MSLENTKNDSKEPSKVNAGAARLLSLSLFLLVPVMYVFGNAYWSAWLQAYGLTAATFPLPVDQAIYQVYVAIMLLGIAALPVLAKASLMVACLLALWLVSAILLLVWGAIGVALRGILGQGLRYLESLVSSRKSAAEFFAKSYMLASAPFFLWGGALYLFVILLIPLLLGDYAGKWQGNKSHADLIQRIKSVKPKESDQVIVLSANGARLYLVACGDNGCGGIDEHGSRFIRWESIREITKASEYSEAGATQLPSGTEKGAREH